MILLLLLLLLWRLVIVAVAVVVGDDLGVAGARRCVVARVAAARLLGASLLLGVVDFVDVLVGLDEVDAELAERRVARVAECGRGARCCG